MLSKAVMALWAGMLTVSTCSLPTRALYHGWEFVRTWRPLATFLLSLHTGVLLYQQSSFPTGPSVQKLFSAFLIDFLSRSLEGAIILHCPFLPHFQEEILYPSFQRKSI